MQCSSMGTFDRGVQMLLSTVGAFAAFSLMTIAVGTDYWLYSRGVCKIKTTNENETSKKNEEVMTHSGLWRTCCLEGKEPDMSLFWSLSCLVVLYCRVIHHISGLFTVKHTRFNSSVHFHGDQLTRDLHFGPTCCELTELDISVHFLSIYIQV